MKQFPLFNGRKNEDPMERELRHMRQKEAAGDWMVTLAGCILFIGLMVLVISGGCSGAP